MRELVKYDGVGALPTFPDVNLLILSTLEASGFYSVQSTLNYRVAKEDKDAHFSCEVSFFVPGAIRTVESQSINVTVHCESPPKSCRRARVELAQRPII